MNLLFATDREIVQELRSRTLRAIANVERNRIIKTDYTVEYALSRNESLFVTVEPDNGCKNVTIVIPVEEARATA